MTEPATRDHARTTARLALRTYLMRSGLTAHQFADQLGYSWHSIRQFISAARYGDCDGHLTAEAVLAWLRENQLPAPVLPGTLYETHATRAMDSLIEHVKSGGWGILYGPSGAQKSFYLEYRHAEANQGTEAAEPRVVCIRSSPSGMTPTVLLRRIAAGLAAPFAQSADALRQSILLTLRRRSRSVALVLDEADALDRFVEALETLREIGDLGRVRGTAPGMGILLAGNEKVMEIFRDRRGVYLEKWRGRIMQKEVRVLGPSPEEASVILAAELGAATERARQAVIERCMVTDPLSHRSYVNMHRLANAIRDVKMRRRAAPATVQ